MTTTDPFTATVACPSCGLFECHRMRSPKPAPTAAEIAEWEDIVEVSEVVLFGGEVVRRVEEPPRPVDESAYEVVRICRCGHEWGQS